ncbi:MAG: hypothetical protein SGILL_003311, partial [Bacillariaceae sp.]
AQLNAALIDAFSGLNMLDYEVFLNDELPDGNVFIGSTVVFIQDDSGGRPDLNTRSGIAATSIAAAAVAFTLLVAGFVIYKRKQDREDPETDKLNKPSGDATIAGETFTGETYDGSAASISAASMEYIGRYRDEDETSKTVSNLGTIPESEDGDQAAQAWGNNSSSEDMDDEEANNTPSVPVASPQSNEAFRDGERIASFEEVALQSFPDNVMQGSFSSSNDESQSQHSSFEHSLGKINTARFHSTPSYDSNDGNTPSVASLSVRDGSTRRPRTVSEIEALLSAGVSRDDDDTVTSDTLEPELTRRTSRPRTVEEIENLLHADLEDDSVLELPFSDEDDTIGDVPDSSEDYRSEDPEPSGKGTTNGKGSVGKGMYSPGDDDDGGYGKGKGGGKGNKSSKSAKSSKSHKSSKSGKSNKSNNNPHPAPSPNRPSKPTPVPRPSDSIDMRNPTPAPPPTSSISVTLDQYAIDYVLSDTVNLPIRDDFLALEEVTSEYFEEYMMEAYSASTQAKLISFDTVLWRSIAYFTDDSIIIPTATQISNVLQQSLDEPDDYLEILSSLSSSNPFSETLEAYFGIPRDPPSEAPNSSTTRSTAGGVSGIIGAVVGLTLVLAGFVVYQNRTNKEENEEFDDTQKLNNGDGDVTVAGDTYTGDTHDGSASTYPNSDDEQQSCSQSDSVAGKAKLLWSRISRSFTSQSDASEQELQDFDEFVCHDSQGESRSMSGVLSEALASYPDTDQGERVSYSDAEPLDSTLRKLKQDIDEMKELGLDGMDTDDSRRPKTVEEIERLLEESAGEIR